MNTLEQMMLHAHAVLQYAERYYVEGKGDGAIKLLVQARKLISEIEVVAIQERKAQR